MKLKKMSKSVRRAKEAREMERKHPGKSRHEIMSERMDEMLGPDGKRAMKALMDQKGYSAKHAAARVYKNKRDHGDVWYGIGKDD